MSVPSPENVSLAEDYINRAWVKLEEAGRQMQSILYDGTEMPKTRYVTETVRPLAVLLR
jgi:hypothetical protein